MAPVWGWYVTTRAPLSPYAPIPLFRCGFSRLSPAPRGDGDGGLTWEMRKWRVRRSEKLARYGSAPHPQVGAKNYWPVAAAAAAAMTAAAAVAAVTVTAATGGPSETPLLPQRKLIFKGAPRRRRFDLKIGGGTPMTDRPSLASSQGLSPL